MWKQDIARLCVLAEIADGVPWHEICSVRYGSCEGDPALMSFKESLILIYICVAMTATVSWS